MINKKELALWVVMGLYALMMAWPASHWYDAGEMWIDDFPEGGEMPMRYHGGAKRDFIGSYSVIVRRSSNEEVVAEDRSTPFQYSANSVRPAPLTIDWWAPGDERMKTLPAGEYQMETCWTVHGAFWGIVRSKTTCVESNIFRVLSGG